MSQMWEGAHVVGLEKLGKSWGRSQGVDRRSCGRCCRLGGSASVDVIVHGDMQMR